MQRIEIRTLRQIPENDHKLDCWCGGCRRWAKCNLVELVADGIGDRDPQYCRPRYRKCESVGEWRLEGPIPTAPKSPGEGVSSMGDAKGHTPN
jgi:hypothetical protein